MSRFSTTHINCALVLLLACSATAQISGNASPAVAPIGCPIQMTITNDTASVIGTGACYYQVYDAITGAPVYAPMFCVMIWLPIGPGQTLTMEWPQINSSGGPVPAGQYVAKITLPNGGGQVSRNFTIVPTTPNSAAIAQLGTFRAGTTRSFDLWAPNAANDVYLVLASATTVVGNPTCAGVFPLDFDFLLAMSLNYNSGVFQATYGLLNGAGRSQSPAIAVPAGVSGVTFNVAFVAVDPTQSCGITAMSAAEPITIQ